MISIIIPLAPHETGWQKLVNQIEQSQTQFSIPYEILLCSVNNPFQENTSSMVKWVPVHLNTNHNPRALSLNTGAKVAQYPFLWFIHADSLLSHNSLSQLIHSLQNNPEHLHYFQLAFMPYHTNCFKQWIWNDLMKLNAIGANLRSQWFKAPFGDQGFCLHHSIFKKLKGYPLNCTYGEDHLLTLKAKSFKIPFCMIPVVLLTSPRKYIHHGWLKTTLQHQYLWLKQRYLFYSFCFMFFSLTI